MLKLIIITGVLALGANAEIRCTSGTVGSTCPDVAPVCCFIEGRFTQGCCRIDEVCEATGCAQAPPMNTSWSDLTESAVTIHFTAAQIITFVAIVLVVLGSVFFSVCGGAQASKRLADFTARRAAARARAAEPSSDDDAVDSGDEKAFRRELNDKKLLTTTTTPSPKPEEGKAAAIDPRQEHGDDDADEGEDAEEKDCLISKGNVDTPSRVGSEVSGGSGAPGASGASKVGSCVLCTAVVDCLLLDCHHSVVCSACAKRLKYCPECKRKIRRRKHIYV